MQIPIEQCKVDENKMALSYKCDVFCDLCSDWLDGGETQHGSAHGLGREARDSAKDAGWLRKRAPDGRMLDICPACKDKDISKALAEDDEMYSPDICRDGIRKSAALIGVDT